MLSPKFYFKAKINKPRNFWSSKFLGYVYGTRRTDWWMMSTRPPVSMLCVSTCCSLQLSGCFPLQLTAISWHTSSQGATDHDSTFYVFSPSWPVETAGLQRQLAKPKQKKEPVTIKMLTSWIRGSGLSDVRSCAWFVWGTCTIMYTALLVFPAFLICNELINVCCCDVEFRL